TPWSSPSCPTPRWWTAIRKTPISSARARSTSSSRPTSRSRCARDTSSTGSTSARATAARRSSTASRWGRGSWPAPSSSTRPTSTRAAATSIPASRRAGPSPRSGGCSCPSCTATGPAGSTLVPGDELVEEAGLALEEALGVERVGQAQVLVVEVVADLVEQRAQEGAEGHHAAVAHGPHPDADARPAPLVARVEAVQLRVAQAGTDGQDADVGRRHAEHRGQGPAEAAGRPLERRAIVGQERGAHRRHQRAQLLRPRQPHLRHAIAGAVDGLVALAQPVVVRKRHPRVLVY